jgi:hypothetical protein
MIAAGVEALRTFEHHFSLSPGLEVDLVEKIVRAVLAASSEAKQGKHSKLR